MAHEDSAVDAQIGDRILEAVPVSSSSLVIARYDEQFEVRFGIALADGAVAEKPNLMRLCDFDDARDEPLESFILGPENPSVRCALSHLSISQEFVILGSARDGNDPVQKSNQFAKLGAFLDRGQM